MTPCMRISAAIHRVKESSRRAIVIAVASCCLTVGISLAAPRLHVVTQPLPTSSEAAFLQESDVAMRRMMANMVIRPSGNIDRDFVDMMVPHHQGAIDMAIAVLRYGHNERIRRLAQEIIVTQQQEIAAMRRAVGEAPPPPTPSPTSPARPPSAGPI